MRIADIIIGERHRKDMGDIEALARSIADVGLLHPIVVRSDNVLIAGERRIQAALMRDWTEIPATIIDLQSVLDGERAENVQRKDWTPSEAVAIGRELEPMEREAAKDRQGTRRDLEPSENFTGSESLAKVATAVGMSRPTYVKAKEVVEAAEAEPQMFSDLVAKMDETGKVNPAHKEYKKRKREAARKAIAEEIAQISVDDRWSVHIGDIRVYQTDRCFDFIITDPPYSREFLPLYEVLAQRAKEWLKPGGLLIAMCGQSYLDQIIAMMSKHMAYYWTGCYLTPGQPTPLRQRQVNTSWKPILIYTKPGEIYKGKIFGDVWVSGGSDKEHDEWGQSESGMLALLGQVALAGQSICDPFCGAGTTGVAALMHGCTFHGIDIEQSKVEKTQTRLVRLYDEKAI